MKKILKYTKASFLLLLIAACGGGGGGGGATPMPPSEATLIFPADNTECNEGTIISDTQSDVNFSWNSSADTDMYELNIRNLTTGQTQTVNTPNTQVNFTIFRGTPYEWWVVSSNNETSQTAQSAAWRFYNAGLAVEHYAPFPAELNSPQMGIAVDAVAGEVSLVWAGEDIDNDITDYDIYFGTDNPPAAMAGNTTATSLSVAVSSGQIYYWMVVSRDSEGNTSDSGIFEFRVN